jgi:ADP-ribosylglycohydrolase
MNLTEAQINIIKGVFYGQAIGDALGLGTEFMTKTQVNQVYPTGLKNYYEIIQDDHRKRWEIGDWTDDTDQFLCIVDAILENKEITELGFAKEIFNWFKGIPMGIGATTFKVLDMPQYVSHPKKAAEIVWKLHRKMIAANGAIMRTSILGLWEFWDNKKVIGNTKNICQSTHFDPRCVGSCVIITAIISNLMQGKKSLTNTEILNIAESYDERISEYILLTNEKEIEVLNLSDEKTVGYTLKALSAGLWTLNNSDSFEEGILAVIDEGGDADSNGAVAGSLLGAKFGYDSIPNRLKNGLIYKDILDKKIKLFIELLESKFNHPNQFQQTIPTNLF